MKTATEDDQWTPILLISALFTAFWAVVGIGFLIYFSEPGSGPHGIVLISIDPPIFVPY